MTRRSDTQPRPLREFLERLTPGDTIRSAAASRATGLDAGVCEEVFKALVRVGLFSRTRDGAFIRRRMIQMPGL